MPKELVRPFLKQGRRTMKQHLLLAAIGCVLLKLGMPRVVA